MNRGILSAWTGLVTGCLAAGFGWGQTTSPSVELPAWVNDVGARQEPGGEQAFLANAFGAVADGETLSTGGIQGAIDACFRAGGGVVTFAPGTYLTGALFIKSNVHLRIDEAVTLLGTQDESQYPKIWTRVAGIEMEWPAALINVNNQANVKLSGGGTIDGDGSVWWDKYWMMRRQDYEPRGIRWAADYDAERVRLMVVWRSSDVTVENLHLKRSGFWTVQVVYSDHVTVDGITVSDNGGPSTDGVNIDSSSYVLVENCDIDNNDDCICLKSGRDWDGQRVNRPAEYVVVRNNLTRRGGGVISFGSETSGGIRHVVGYGNRGQGTSTGYRFKSAAVRGGYVRDVLIIDGTMENVRVPFSFELNWNPSYSYATIPDEITDYPDYWVTMNTPVLPVERGYADFSDITIANIQVTGARTIIRALGLPQKSFGHITFRNITARGAEAGSIQYAQNWTMENVVFATPGGRQIQTEDVENVDLPKTVATE